MLKIIRVTRIRQLITTATLDKGIKAALNFVYLTLLLLFYCHIVGCFWYYVVFKDYCTQNLQIKQACNPLNRQDENDPTKTIYNIQACDDPENCRVIKWIPPYDFWDYTKSNFFCNPNNDDVACDGLPESDMWRRFIVCVYYMVLVIGGNELGPQTEIQYIFIVAVNLTGAIINAVIFGDLAVLMSQILRQGADFQQQIDTANIAMTNIKLPSDVQQEVREFYATV
jgi:hypothetical protein